MGMIPRLWPSALSLFLMPAHAAEAIAKPNSKAESNDRVMEDLVINKISATKLAEVAAVEAEGAGAATPSSDRPRFLL